MTKNRIYVYKYYISFIRVVRFINETQETHILLNGYIKGCHLHLFLSEIRRLFEINSE